MHNTKKFSFMFSPSSIILLLCVTSLPQEQSSTLVESTPAYPCVPPNVRMNG